MSRNIDHDIKDLADNITKLTAENGLLRAASQEQRELNGELRQQLQDNAATLAKWINWFNTWGALIDGDCHAEGAKLVVTSTGVINGYY